MIMKSCFSDIFKDCYFRGILLHVTHVLELDNKTSCLIGHVPDTQLKKPALSQKENERNQGKMWDLG